MSESYSKSIANAVKDVLAAEEFNFSFDEDNGLFRLNGTIEGPIHSLDIFIDIGRATILFVLCRLLLPILKIVQ